MSSNNRDHKRSGLASQIEIEIIRDSDSSEDVSMFATGTNPLSILQQLVDQAEELEQTTSEVFLEALSPSQMRNQLALFQKQNSVLKKMLNKMN